MFKGTDHFKSLPCPEQECSRSYCPFRHSVPVTATNVSVAAPQAIGNQSRTLPSYAPQNSSEAKVTVDYQKLLRGCKAYKSADKDVTDEPSVQPDNIFDKFSSNCVKNQPSLNKKPVHVEKNNLSDRRKQRSSKQEVSPRKKRGLVKLPNLTSCDMPMLSNTNEKEKTCKSEPTKDEESFPKAEKPNIFDKIGLSKRDKPIKELKRSALEENGHDAASKDIKVPKYNGENYYMKETPDTSDMVYKPGVGIMQSAENHRKDVPKRKLQLTELNSSLDFHDPYADDSIPKATSPSRTGDLNKTFSISASPLKESERSDVPSSQESSVGKCSLVIEETPESSEERDENDEIDSLPEDEPSVVEISSSSTSVSDEIKPDIDVIELEDIECIEVKPPEPTKPEFAPREPAWKKNLSSKMNETIENEVFGGNRLSTSPIKFRKTFQKKRPSPQKIKQEKEHEEEIINDIFAKDLEDRSLDRTKESPSKASDTKSSTHSEVEESDHQDDPVNQALDSDEEPESEKKREERLEQIKELKAKIFIKQMKQANKSSSESSDSSDNESSSDDGNESPASRHDSDSDFSIDSNKSVESSSSSSSSSSSDSGSPNGSTRSSPIRKRKRYSSPTHTEVTVTELCDIKPVIKPIIALAPKPIKVESQHPKKETSEKNSSGKKDLPPSLKNRHTIQVGIEVAPNSLKRKKTDVEAAEKLLRKQRQEEERNKHRERKKKHEEHKKRKALKPGVRHNVQSSMIIPHQKKISDKKQKIMEQYDKRMKTGSNSATFYQKPASESSRTKFKKEDLAHFDPPTPPPEDDPHRFAQMGRKNRGKRIAHNPSAAAKKFANETKPKEEKVGSLHKDGPRIKLTDKTHVPVNVRQTRLDAFITEYLKIWGDDRQKCFDQGVKDETQCLESCKTKSTYIMKCSNNVKRIREITSKTNGGANDPSSSSRSNTSDQEKLFHSSLLKYKMSKADLQKNLYPGYYQYKDVVLDGLHCVRCSSNFQLDVDGEYVRPDRCYHHSGKLRTTKSRGPKGELDKVRMYECCDAGDGAMGCSIATGHVFQVAYLNRDWREYLRTRKRPDHAPGVYALDCEMAYTAGGMELVRVTIVDMYGKQALDMLVQPPHRILDYNTKYSGISAETLRNVEHSLEDAQRAVCRIISAESYIIGHSLESDLHALKMIHKNVVDTSVVYYGGGYKRGLAALSAETLGRIIQQDEEGHDSTEDAIAALDLMKKKLKVTDNVRIT